MAKKALDSGHLLCLEALRKPGIYLIVALLSIYIVY